jgi:hypothetical protein
MMATLLSMNEACPGKEFFVPSVTHFQCKCFAARTPATKCFLNKK